MAPARQADGSTPTGYALGLASGVGLVVANMIGAGVFLSAGFMAQNLGPGTILLGWLVGLGLALAGALTYASVATRIPRSGGEYRYLSDLLHPALGSLAGWISLLVGFSAPIAVNALAAGAFAQVLTGLDGRLVALGLVALLTLLHATGLKPSAWSQNALVVLKAALVLGFVGLGLAGGHNAWPSWSPPEGATEFEPTAFAVGLFFIAFAFSGWNATAYAAEEFREPRRTVPRAMLLGCGAVGLLYLAVNWVFVANLTPAEAAVVLRYEAGRATLGHLVAERILGPTGATLMSSMLIVVFASAASAMLFLGPRVIAAMAGDGFLPRRLAAAGPGRPPTASVILQGALAAGLLLAYPLQRVLQSVGAIVTLFSALVALGLLLRGRSLSLAPRLVAGVYFAGSCVLLGFGIKDDLTPLLWLAAAVVPAAIAYGLTSARRRLS